MDKLSTVSLESIIQEHSSLTFKQRVKKYIFSSLLDILKTEISHDPVRWSSKIMQAIVNVGILLQLSSFMWRPDTQLHDWKSYEIFWKFISFTRVDLVCAYLKILSEMHFFVNSCLYAQFLVFVVIQIFLVLKKKPLVQITYLLKKSMQVFSSILFIPSLTLLLIDLKSFSDPQSSLNEYSIASDSYGNYLNLFRSITSLVILIVFSYAYEAFSVEIRHCYKDKYLLAKASSDVDLNVKILYTAIVVMYVLVYDIHAELFKFIVFLIYVYITIQYLVTIPYYSRFMNNLKIVVSSCEAFVTLWFLIGYIVNDSKTILLLTLFVVPCTAVISYWIANYRYTLIRKVNPKYCSFTQLEIYLREKLSSSEKNPQILTMIDNCLKSNKYKGCLMGPIWETYYCTDVLSDFRLAFIKLSKCWKMPYSPVQDFFKFKCENMLNSINLSTLEDLSYMRYALIYEDLKRRDMELCITLLKFWGELITGGDLSKLNILVHKSTKNIDTIRKGYEFLIEKYPSSSKCRETFRSFLAEICIEANLSSSIVNRMNSNKSHLDNGDLNYYNENNGMILVSSNDSNAGMIIYANSKFAEILGQNLNTIIGSNINTYIPSKYAKTHNSALLNFVEYCIDVNVPFNGSLFFQTETGYLVETEIRSRCTAIAGNVFFLAMVKKLEHKRHIIHLSDKGIILSYSQKLPDFINIGNFKMSTLDEIFPFSSDDLQLNVLYSVGYRGKKIGVVKTHRCVGKTKISVLIIYENDSDMEIIESNQVDESSMVVKHELDIESIQKKNFKVGFADETNFSLHPAFSKNYTEETGAKEKKIEKSTHSSTSTTSASERFSKKILNEAVRGILIYKIILLIFVLIGIATSLTVLARIKIDLIEENNPSITMFLGKVSNSVISISVATRIIDLKIKNNLPYDLYNQIFDDKIKEINELVQNLSDYSNKYWSDCDSKEFLTKDIMPVAYLNETLFFSHTNLYNFLIAFRDNAITARTRMITKEKAYSQELFYVIANGVVFSLDFIIEQTINSATCSKNRSFKVNFTKNIIMFLGISVLFLSIAYVIFFVVSLSKKINDLWSFLSKLSNNAYKSCVATYTNRLSIVNGIEESEINEHLIKENSKIIKFNINFSQIWRYIWRIFIFSGLSISFYLLITLYYCSEIENYIVIRAELITDFIQKNNLLFLMNFYIVEFFCTGSQYEIKVYYPQINFVDHAAEKIDSLISNYESIKNNIKDKDYIKCMPSQAYTSIFEGNDTSSTPYINYGLYSALEFIVQDTSYVKGTFDYNYHDTYTKISTEIFQNQEYISALIDNELKSAMNYTFTIILIATILYSLISLLLYFCMYIPYLNKEAKQLKKIQSLCKLVGSVEKKIVSN